jgi:hypothetical protein
MLINIKKYEFKKIEVESKIFELPETESYCFETHVRRSIRIKPVFTTWNKELHNKEEELYSFDITCVYLSFECKIVKFSISVSDFDDLSKMEKNEFLNAWVSGWFNFRTKEQFDTDLKVAIDKINE